ncbi:hypothetical protein [Palleronia pontilimi]|nr:hypothetical protein [Palleronia pontilimi]
MKMNKLILLALIVSLSGCALIRTPVKVVGAMGHATIDLATAPF